VNGYFSSKNTHTQKKKTNKQNNNKEKICEGNSIELKTWTTDKNLIFKGGGKKVNGGLRHSFDKIPRIPQGTKI